MLLESSGVLYFSFSCSLSRPSMSILISKLLSNKFIEWRNGSNCWSSKFSKNLSSASLPTVFLLINRDLVTRPPSRHRNQMEVHFPAIVLFLYQIKFFYRLLEKNYQIIMHKSKIMKHAKIQHWNLSEKNIRAKC